MTRETVVLLVISTQYGDNVEAHWTEESANESLYNYVTEWWDAEGLDEDMPEDRDRAIETYFEILFETKGESYEIQRVVVHGERNK